ncbi:hypothetical protein [Burkholderia ubonensis]|uniref:hypothetical protein n=1 Tax=Burkholderia ubonensis TaxID=101571 RepID=UPI0021AA4AAA|nr:hypothetical protein [Burkholderia ubonensis]
MPRLHRCSTVTRCHPSRPEAVSVEHEAKRFEIDFMGELAAAHGGHCLSENCRNTATRLEWACQQGHRWWAFPGAIVRGHWCSVCSRDAVKLGIDVMRRHAAEHGGKCISDTL